MVKSNILSNYSQLVHFFGDKRQTNSLFRLGINPDNIINAEQIHRNKLAIIENVNDKLIKGVDGMITGKQIVLGIRTADCMPIFMYDHKKKIAAAIHAGWKGLSLGIIKNAITEMKKLGSKPTELIISIGPHIRVCCYNTPMERVQKFDKSFGEKRGIKWYLDLAKIALFQLEESGIIKSSIEISQICTSCDRSYWSFRRDGEKCGRMLNIIGMIK